MNNYSYITLLTNDSYVYGVVLLFESMRRTNTYYPLHVLVNDEVSAASLEILNQLGITYQIVPTIPTPSDIYEHNLNYESNTAATWRNCWTKLHIFDQVQFDKIVFLDADIIILKNLDHLFNCPHMTSCLDGEYFNLWPDWPHFNSGCIVIEPSHELFLSIYNFANNLKEAEMPEYIIADQEILNFYYRDWINHPELKLNKYYDIFAPYILESQIIDIEENCYFIHYVGRKPWTFWYKTEQEVYTEHFYSKAKTMIEDVINTQLNWELIHKKLVLTVYAICKNEVENVSKYLNSFGEADYVCILDTGSTDGTWELLQELQKTHQNLIISQKTIVPWRYDKARNLSMELIPKETTIFFMADLDEVIKEPGWCNIVKSHWDPLFDRGMYTYNRDVGENDSIIRSIPEYRIHSADWYKWVNIVHEALINHAGNKQFLVETCTKLPITVWHYPNPNKQQNYLELCEHDLLEEPNDYVMRLQLAIEYDLRNQYDKAAEHFLHLIQDPGNLQDFELARCYCSLGKIADTVEHNKQKALAYFREGRLIAPNVIDNYLAAAEIYYNDKDYKKALDLAKDGLRESDTARWCNNYDPQSFFPYWVIGMSYFFLDDKFMALSFMRIAELKHPTEDIRKICDSILSEIHYGIKNLI